MFPPLIFCIRSRIPYTRAAYYALSTGAVQMYNINMQYGYVPNAASTTSCPAGINSGSAAAPCRSVSRYSFCSTSG